MATTSLLKARKPRGFQDRLDRQVAEEERLVAAIAGVYERWGFARLETPAIEYTDALGKYLPDVDRPNEGVFAFKDDDAQWVSLRYDLTAPLARFVAENWNDLPRPFRRWQAGPVWRNEKPGPGRYRQFTQCDADSVGVPGVAADAEIVMMAAEAIEAAGIARGEYAFKINTRRLLNGLLDLAAGGEAMAAQRTAVLRAIDKLDRLGPGGVVELLGRGRKDESGDFTSGAGLDAAAIDRVMAFLKSGAATRRETLRNLEAALKGSAEGEAGIADLAAIADILDRCGVDDARAAFDPSIVRGLDYYTGPVFEAHLKVSSAETGKPIDFGSVGGGGRYDDLVARFRGEAVPATGFSFGVSRLLAALDAAGRTGGGDAPGPVVVLAFEKDRMAD
ncbi:MAG: histidine--tRNA ligase, partial [Parvularculaceae bacterium]